jgi:hypothetical protein
VRNPNVAQKARLRGLPEARVRALLRQPTSHLELQAALAANGKSSEIVDDITTVNLSQSQALFAVVGVFPNNHLIQANSPEALAIQNYIQSGGKVYMEGGDMWFWDPANANGHDFAPLFGLDGLEDGADPGDLGTIRGASGTFTQGMHFTYSGHNIFIDRLTAIGNGFVIHANQSPAYNCGIARSNTGTGAKTIGNSYQFGGLNDNSASSFTKNDLMQRYLTHFGVTTLPAPQPVTFEPAHDASVNSSEISSNYGSSSSLRIKNTSELHLSYLKFVVSGLSGSVQRAKLRLEVSDKSKDGGSIFLVPNNYAGTSNPWTEAGLNYSNAPSPVGNSLSSVGEVEEDTVIEFDVTVAITGNGTFSFVIKNTPSSAVKYSSKEGTTPPQLVIQTMPAVAAKVADLSPEANELKNAEMASVPERLALSPNYPNPFNAQTVIEYALPAAARVRLVIYNLMGHQVLQLIDETQPAGFKRVLWNGKDKLGQDVSTGVYFYYLEVGGQKLTKKMIVQR